MQNSFIYRFRGSARSVFLEANLSYAVYGHSQQSEPDRWHKLELRSDEAGPSTRRWCLGQGTMRLSANDYVTFFPPRCKYCKGTMAFKAFPGYIVAYQG